MASTPWLGPGQQGVTQGFGPTDFALEPAYGGYPHFHRGIDIGAPSGTSIIDQIAGVIRNILDAGGYGRHQVLDIGGGRELLFGHESSFAVPSGSRVSPGQVIGYVGSTGLSTGPHLHFEEDVGGKPVDPSTALFNPKSLGGGDPNYVPPDPGTGPQLLGFPNPGDLPGELGKAVASGIAAAAGPVAAAVGAGVGQGFSTAATTVGHGLANALGVSVQNAQTFIGRNFVALIVAAVVVTVLFL